MPAPIDMVEGSRVGRLTVIGPAESAKGLRRLLCQCDCGNQKAISVTGLRRTPPTQSCGCIKREQSSKMFRKHGGTVAEVGDKRLFVMWCGMKARTTNKNHIGAKYYYDLGIKVCEGWLDFNTFREWAKLNGYRKGLQLDREDSKGNYCPENCRWVTHAQNSRNRSNTIKITFGGVTLTLAEMTRKLGFKRGAIQSRLYRGWDLEKALTTPIGVVHDYKLGQMRKTKLEKDMT